MKPTRRVVVAGGAGAMGRITVRDLVETAPSELEIVAADYDLAAARSVARTHARREVRPLRLDVRDPARTARALRGCFGVIGAMPHQLNVPLMRASLSAGAHYCDLGGLFHVTRKQLPWHRRFERAGLLAVPGIGAAPGIVNVLARAAADDLDRVLEIHVKVASIDRTSGRPTSPLETSYSLSTVLDEANLPAALFTGGELTFVEPMSGAEEVDFPEPVGRKRPSCTLHSEVATLPESFAAKGVREVSFRIAFSAQLEAQLRFLRALGASSAKAIEVPSGTKSARVVPRDVLLALAARLPPPTCEGMPDEYEVLRVVVKGTTGGRPVTEVLDCHCAGMPAWGLGIDIDTGCPPSILMQMLARGDIVERGVLPPERVIPAAPFFGELEARGMRIVRRVGSDGATGRDDRPGPPPGRVGAAAA